MACSSREHREAFGAHALVNGLAGSHPEKFCYARSRLFTFTEEAMGVGVRRREDVSASGRGWSRYDKPVIVLP